MNKQDIKLNIAYWLEYLFPDKWCWADLVFWAVFDTPWSDIDPPSGCGYCGKCERLGILRE